MKMCFSTLGVPEQPPTLAQFKEQIDSYEKVYEDVLQLEGIAVFGGWFRVKQVTNGPMDQPTKLHLDSKRLIQTEYLKRAS